MPKLIATTPIHHDGQYYPEGDTFDVSDKRSAQALVTAGVARYEQKADAKAKADAEAEAEAKAKADAEAKAKADAEKGEQ